MHGGAGGIHVLVNAENRTCVIQQTVGDRGNLPVEVSRVWVRVYPDGRYVVGSVPKGLKLTDLTGALQAHSRALSAAGGALMAAIGAIPYVPNTAVAAPAPAASSAAGAPQDDMKRDGPEPAAQSQAHAQQQQPPSEPVPESQSQCVIDS